MRDVDSERFWKNVLGRKAGFHFFVLRIGETNLHRTPDLGTLRLIPVGPKETRAGLQGREVLASPWRRLRAVRFARTTPIPKSLRKRIFKFPHYMLNRYRLHLRRGDGSALGPDACKQRISPWRACLEAQYLP